MAEKVIDVAYESTCQEILEKVELTKKRLNGTFLTKGATATAESGTLFEITGKGSLCYFDCAVTVPPSGATGTMTLEVDGEVVATVSYTNTAANVSSSRQFSFGLLNLDMAHYGDSGGYSHSYFDIEVSVHSSGANKVYIPLGEVSESIVAEAKIYYIRKVTLGSIPFNESVKITFTGNKTTNTYMSGIAYCLEE